MSNGDGCMGCGVWSREFVSVYFIDSQTLLDPYTLGQVELARTAPLNITIACCLLQSFNKLQKAKYDLPGDT